MILTAVSGLVAVALYAALAIAGSWGREFTRFLALHGALLAVYAVAAAAVLRAPGAGSSAGVNRPDGAGRARTWLVVLLFAAAFRGILVFAPPALSDDLYRYIWDGRVLLHGVNPFRYPPTAPELAPLRDSIWALINYPHLPTVYPPVLQLVFAAVAFVSPTVFAMKAAMALFDLAAGVCLMAALRALGRRPELALLYLWNPLPTIEFAGSGHADAVGIFLVSLAILLWARRRAFASGVAIALAGLVKFLPWVALPLFLPRLRWKWLLLPAMVVALYLPFHLGGVNAFGNLPVYAAKWRGNDFLFALLDRGDDPEASLRRAKLWAAGIVAAVWVVTVATRRPWLSVYSWTVGALLLVSPIVHPWYVVWLLPAALFLPHPAWWAWSVLAVLAYHPLPGFLADGVWRESWAMKSLEYVPVLAMVAVQVALERRAGRAASGMLLRP